MPHPDQQPAALSPRGDHSCRRSVWPSGHRGVDLGARCSVLLAHLYPLLSKRVPDVSGVTLTAAICRKFGRKEEADGHPGQGFQL